MTSEERVVTLFTQANPIRDPEGVELDDADTSAHLESLETRSIDMTTTIERTAAPGPARGRWIAAAVVAATVGAIAVLAASGPSDPVPITTLDQRIEVIESLVAVHNSGDFPAFRDRFTDSPDVFGSTRESDADWEFQRSFMAANEQWEFVGECTERPTDRTVICPLTLKNDFMEPAGLYFDVPSLEFDITETGSVRMIGASFWEIAGEPEDYSAAFDSWLSSAHPDLHAGLGPRVEGWGMMPNADDMPGVLPYVDEFLAQSSDYPLEAE
jgi:hypothetical protein